MCFLLPFLSSVGEELSLCSSGPVAPVNRYPDMYVSD